MVTILISFGGLIQPPDYFLNIIDDLEIQFQKFHGKRGIKTGKCVVTRTANFLSKNCTDIDSEIVHEFSRQRIFIRIKYLN